jgi:hypothetical protein
LKDGQEGGEKEKIGIGTLRRGPRSVEEKCVGTLRTGRRRVERE